MFILFIICLFIIRLGKFGLFFILVVGRVIFTNNSKIF